MRAADRLRQTIEKLKLVEASSPGSSAISNAVIAGLRRGLTNPNQDSPLSSTTAPDVKAYWSRNGALDYVRFEDDLRVNKHIIVRRSDHDHTGAGTGMFSREQKYFGVSYYMLVPEQTGSTRKGEAKIVGNFYPKIMLDEYREFGGCVFTFMCFDPSNEVKEHRIVEKAAAPKPEQQQVQFPDTRAAALRSYDKMRDIGLESILGAGFKEQELSRFKSVDYAIVSDKTQCYAFVCGMNVHEVNMAFKQSISQELDRFNSAFKYGPVTSSTGTHDDEED